MDDCRLGICLTEISLSLGILRTRFDDRSIKYSVFLMSLIIIVQWMEVFTKSFLPPTEFVRAL